MNAINLPTQLKLQAAQESAEATTTEPMMRPTTLEGHEQQLADPVNEFDWNNSSRVVLQDQPKTAIFVNSVGQITILQQAGPLDETDTAVWFNRESLPAIIAELQRQLNEN